MIGPVLALLCFASLLVWGAIERRRAETREMVLAFDRLRDTVIREAPSFGRAFDRLSTASLAAAAAHGAFFEAWWRGEQQDWDDAQRFLDG